MNVTGEENARGTVKITHDGYVDGSDADGSALSIDLRRTAPRTGAAAPPPRASS